MQFTYDSYIELVNKIKQNGYEIADYNNYKCVQRPCILRHDIDTDLDKAVKFAEVECENGIKSTFFVRLTSELYNVLSCESISKIKRINRNGAEIGLHFDERNYPNHDIESLKEKAEYERKILSELLEMDIKVISMHRPSKEFLDADVKFKNMINSYSYEFFNNFKYLSDSRRCWREDVEKIVESKEYDRLHILTHAFWYTKEEEEMRFHMKKFMEEGCYRIWDIMNRNFTNLSDVVKRNELNRTL